MLVAFIALIQSIVDDVVLADKGARPGLDHLVQVMCHRFVVECQQTVPSGLGLAPKPHQWNAFQALQMSPCF